MSHCVPNWGDESFLATHKPPAHGTVHRENVDLVPWFDGQAGEGKAVATAATARDAVVPCAVSGEDGVEGVQAAPDSEGGCTRVGSCSGPATWEFSKAEDEGSVNASSYARVPVAEEEWSSEGGGSASLDMSDTFDGSRRVPTMSSRELSESSTTSFFSLDDTISGSWRSDAKNTTPSHDNSSSVFRGRNQREEADTEERSNKEGTSKSSSTKRSRCKADQSQRKRRERIDQRMNKLQRLVPTSKRGAEKDKEWVLDEVIEYVRQLQAQLQMMMTMMMPIPMMSMPMMPMGMQQGYAQNLPLPACVFPAVYMPTAYPQSQWRPTLVEEAHSRMAAASLMQHHQQFPFIFQHGNLF